MEVFLVREEYWHDVEGMSYNVVDIYAEKCDADLVASELNAVQGFEKHYCSLEFTVVTYRVK